jgi:hypothetical protein
MAISAGGVDPASDFKMRIVSRCHSGLEAKIPHVLGPRSAHARAPVAAIETGSLRVKSFLFKLRKKSDVTRQAARRRVSYEQVWIAPLARALRAAKGKEK